MNLVSSGMFIEPLLHPKPGAVTRILGHRDKDVVRFAVHASLAGEILVRGCERSRNFGCRGGISYMLSEYLERVAHKFKDNIAYGTFFLLAPIASALGMTSSTSPAKVAAAARDVVEGCTGERESTLHLKILRLISPSHLGRYRGPIPDVFESSSPPPLPRLLRLASWDLVHSEPVKGYPVSLEAFNSIQRMVEEGYDLEGASLAALLGILAEWGDTLIYQKFGGRAYILAMREARAALEMSRRLGVMPALVWLDSIWRPRGWNPGAILDILAVGIGFYMLEFGSS